MGKKANGFDKDRSEWTEDEKFADFLRQYIQEDACAKAPRSRPGAFITYKSLHRLYTVSTEAQEKLEALDKGFSELLSQVNGGLEQLEKVTENQKKTHQDARFRTRLLCVAAILLYAIATYFFYQAFLKGIVP